MAAAFLIAAGVSAVLHLVAESRGIRSLVYLFKPLTTSLIIAAAAVMPEGDPRYRVLIVIGLLFSLAGDIFLMFPDDHFQAGLVSFLFAHVAYIVAFSRGTRAQPLALLPFLLVSAVVLRLLWPHLGRLRLAVLVYVLALVAMAWLAASRAAAWPALPTYGAAIGAALFLFSDATLAIRKFRGPFAGAQIAIMTTYVAAQALIASSVTGTA